jgi:hypothetical protein
MIGFIACILLPHGTRARISTLNAPIPRYLYPAASCSYLYDTRYHGLGKSPFMILDLQFGGQLILYILRLFFAFSRVCVILSSHFPFILCNVLLFIVVWHDGHIDL